jgi:hypothetical protein
MDFFFFCVLAAARLSSVTVRPYLKFPRAFFFSTCVVSSPLNAEGGDGRMYLKSPSAFSFGVSEHLQQLSDHLPMVETIRGYDRLIKLQ